MATQPSRKQGNGKTYRERTKPWYGTQRWKRRRKAQLEAEPLCWMCKAEGRLAPATIADHDPPHNGDEDQFWNGPLKSVCKPHHDRHAQKRDRGTALPVTGTDGWPIG